MISAHVVENAVQNNSYAVFMESGADLREVLIRAETLIYRVIVGGIIAVLEGLKNRSEVNGVEVHFFKVGYPLDYFQYPAFFARFRKFGAKFFAAAEAKRINMVNVCLFDPMRHFKRPRFV